MSRRGLSDGERTVEYEEEGRLPAFLRDPFGLLQRRFGWMLLLFLVTAAAGVTFFSWWITPSYMARATVLVSSQSIGAEYLTSSGNSQGAFEKISAMVGETLSTQSLAELIEEYDLYGGLRAESSLPEVAAVMRKNIAIESEASVGPQPYHETAGVFTVSYRAGRRDQAAAVANDLAERFVAAGVRLRNERFQVATTTLAERVDAGKAEVAQREAELRAFRRNNHGGLANDNAALRLEMTRKRAELEQLKSRYTTLHPAVRNLQEEIDGMAGQLENVVYATGEVLELQRRLELARLRLQEHESALGDSQLALRLNNAGDRAIASILDRAEAPMKPERSLGKFLIASVVGALGLAGLLGLFLEYRDPVVIVADQLTEDLGLHLLGGVSRIR